LKQHFRLFRPLEWFRKNHNNKYYQKVLYHIHRQIYSKDEDDEVEEEEQEQEDDTNNDESQEAPSTKHTAKKARKHHTEEDETTIEQPMEILYKKQTDYKIDFDL
jgi:hypothetical protein